MSLLIGRSILPTFNAFFFLILSIQNSLEAAKFGKAYNIYEKFEKADFKCLLPYGEVPVIRIYAGGNVDQNGIKNIENAQAAGYTGTEVYVQPAVLISSKSGSQQFEEAYQFVDAKYPVQRIWLFVTDPRTWATNPKENLQFIRDFVRAGKTKNVVVGIYTSWYDWLLIMGDYKELQNDCAEGNCPLWYWHTLGQGRNAQTSQDFADFRPFGSWKMPAVKEYDIVDNQFCGRNLNWSIFSISKNKIRAMPNRRGIFNRKIKIENIKVDYKFIIGNAF